MPQITQLDNDPTPNNNDLLVTVDIGAGTTKNISRQQFFTGAPLPANTVNGQAIADGSVTSPKLAMWSTSGSLSSINPIPTTQTVVGTVNLPATTVPHNFLVTVNFAPNHNNYASPRDYTGLVRLNGAAALKTVSISMIPGMYNSGLIPISVIVTSTGGADTLDFLIRRSNESGGLQSGSTTSYTVIDIGEA